MRLDIFRNGERIIRGYADWEEADAPGLETHATISIMLDCNAGHAVYIICAGDPSDYMYSDPNVMVSSFSGQLLHII